MKFRHLLAALAIVAFGCEAEQPQPSPPPRVVAALLKSPYVGRWHSRWTETVEGVASMEHDDYLTIAAAPETARHLRSCCTEASSAGPKA